MKRIIFAALATMAIAAPIAHADPAPPSPVLPGPAQGQLPGNQPLPAICATVMIACAQHFDPDRGSWVPNS